MGWRDNARASPQTHGRNALLLFPRRPGWFGLHTDGEQKSLRKSARGQCLSGPWTAWSASSLGRDDEGKGECQNRSHIPRDRTDGPLLCACRPRTHKRSQLLTGKRDRASNQGASPKEKDQYEYQHLTSIKTLFFTLIYEIHKRILSKGKK